MIYGYARVSTDGQSVDAQVKQLREAGAEKVFRETASGKQTDRPGLKRAIAALGKGDVLMVTRLDRLARSTRDLLNTVEKIAAKKAGFRSLGDAWADSTTPHGRLMMTILGGLAEFESSLIHARTGEGRERAKARGVKMGRKPKLTPHQMREAVRRRDKGEPMREIARTYNVSHSTISRPPTSFGPNQRKTKVQLRTLLTIRENPDLTLTGGARKVPAMIEDTAIKARSDNSIVEIDPLKRVPL